jgi:hypothetical protein
VNLRLLTLAIVLTYVVVVEEKEVEVASGPEVDCEMVEEMGGVAVAAASEMAEEWVVVVGSESSRALTLKEDMCADALSGRCSSSPILPSASLPAQFSNFMADLKFKTSQ